MNDIVEYYRQLYQQGGASHGANWLVKLQKNAMDAFLATGFPTRKDEDWKYTRVDAISSKRFDAVSEDAAAEKPSDISSEDTLCLDFANGQMQLTSTVLADLPEGAIVLPLFEAIKKHAELLKRHLSQATEGRRDGFTSLNLALLSGGAFIYLPKNCVLSKPLAINHHTSCDALSTHSRHLVILEEGAELSLIERHTGESGLSYFTNTVSELFLGGSAQLTYCKVLNDSKKAYHIGSTHIHQQGDSQASLHSFSVGGALVRSDLDIRLLGAGANCQMHGLYLAKDKQHIDHHTVIRHDVPHTCSQEYYKGILADAARAVFNGKVKVAVDAQKTDASQQNKNLLLSPMAEIDTKPQLEIFADDVKCAHGATVGQLDADALFYLRSRGLSLDEAKALLVNAFANDILLLIPSAALRLELEQSLHHFLGGL